MKERPKKHTDVLSASGGLEDSDADAVNPFPKVSSKSRKKVVIENELTKGSQTAKHDFSRKNAVCTYSDFNFHF